MCVAASLFLLYRTIRVLMFKFAMPKGELFARYENGAHADAWKCTI